MRRSLRLLLALLMAGALCGIAPAQAQQQISGTVTDGESGESLPGASVSVPGTTVGTATDMDGAYELTVPTEADSLRFSFIGYQPQTVAIGDRSVINISLLPSMQQLDEVVVVGYGEQEARDVTGVVSRVSADELNPTSTISPDLAISGKVAGVQVSTAGGAPGSRTNIRIRGATSVNAGTQPLFVIDGVPIDNEPNTATRNPLNFLNPGDIESVTVLKDASATAIYGSRGANGVIIIETKSGSGEGSRITYNGSVSASNPIDDVDVLDAERFRQVVSERAPEKVPQLGFASTDWQDAIQRQGVGQQHSVSYSASDETSAFRFSAGYLNQDGIIETSSTERLSLSLKYNQDLLEDQLTIRTNLKGSKTQDNFAPGIIGSAVSFDPTQPIRDADGQYGGFNEWEASLPENNPVAEYILSQNIGETQRSLGNVEAEYRVPFVEGLSARVNVGYDISTGEREYFAPTVMKGEAESSFPGTISRNNFSRLTTLLDAYLNYDREFSDYNSRFDITAGYSYQDFQEEYPEFTASGLSSNIYGPNSTQPLADENQITTNADEFNNRLISGFARVNYTFMDRYLLTFTVRRDGSSKFGPKQRWGTFPSAALAWRAHQESFLEDYDVLSNLKFRASWGITGNQEIGDFNYVALYTPGGPQAQVQFGDRFYTTIRPSAADESLKWEETTSTNIGVDFGLFNGRLSGSVEAYRKDTDDLLFTVPVAAGANLSNRVLTNIGEMRNQGIEMNLNVEAISRPNLSYNASINAATNQNELLKIDRGTDEDFQGIDTGGISGGVGNTVQILQEGQPINSFFVYQHKMDDNGNPLYEDVNGDGQIDAQDVYRDVNDDGIINSQDRVVDGNPQPDWIVGHTSNLRVQNADLSVTVRAHLGQQVYNNVASNYGHFQRLEGTVPSNVHETALEYGFESPFYFSDIYVEDASFLRVDNVTLGYTFTSIPRVDQLRIYGSASNLFVLTGYSGSDPEVGGPGSGTGEDVGGGSPAEAGIGIDNNIYPRSRTFTAGINIRL